VVLHDVPQLLHVAHLLVVLHVRLGVAEVAEDEAAQVGLGHVTVTQVCKQSVEVVRQVSVRDAADAREQPGTVVVVDKTVVENTERLQKSYRFFSSHYSW